MKGKVLLQVYGITANQVQNNAYALLLEEADGAYRIPIVVGAAEAQSIAVILENIKTPRPLTHDLFASFAKAFGIRFLSVFIYKFEEGIFYSEIRCTDGDREVTIDARTSDAIALALRSGMPIYTTPEIVAETGFIIDGEELKSKIRSDNTRSHSNGEISLERYTVEELERMMAKAAQKEDYEQAARIRNVIASKK